jgi:hypothetical protein
MKISRIKAAAASIGIALFLLNPGELLAIKIVGVSQEVYESEKVKESLDVTHAARIEFRASGPVSGSVSILTGKTDHRVTYVQHFKANSLEQATEFSDHLFVKVSNEGNVIHVDAGAERKSPWMESPFSARLEINVVVPESLAVQIDTWSFDVTTSGPFSDVAIVNEFGKIKVSDVYNDISIRTVNSRVALTDITGALDVTTSNNTIFARNINTGDGIARFTNEYGELEISEFTGRIHVEASYTPLDLKGVRLKSGESRLATTYGTIGAEIIELNDAELFVRNNFSNVYLALPDDVESEFDLNVDTEGRIYVHDIPIVPEEVDRSHLLARTDNPASRVRVDIDGIGTVDLKGKKFYGVP